MFSNVNLSCQMDFDKYCPDKLLWYFNDNPNSLPLRGEKYKEEVKATSSSCKREFVLSIFNVTKNDEGKYRCRWFCGDEERMEAAIHLEVSVQPPTSKKCFGKM